MVVKIEEMWLDRLEDVKESSKSLNNRAGIEVQGDLPPVSSFTESTDEEFSSALSQRIDDIEESAHQEECGDESCEELTGSQ